MTGKKSIFTLLGVIIALLLSATNARADDASTEGVVFHIGLQTKTAPEEEIAQWLSVNPVLYFDYSMKAEAENIKYCPATRFFCDFCITRRERLAIRKKNLVSVAQDKIRSYLENLAPQVNQDPVDAKFQVEDGKVTTFALAENGLKLNVAESTKIIAKTLLANDKRGKEKGISLAYETIEPEIKSDSANRLGIATLIGEGKSNFRGSPKNRIFNIGVAIKQFNGVLIKPGEEFSFVKTLGPVDAEHGYAPELVIKRNKTEPEFGGGICQVSTTTFRAAIYSGLKITARRNHAYPVRYYNPQGMDATVYDPRPDLRFINNTPGYILIQAKIEGTELIFDFYGTNDGRTIEIEGPKVLERQPDGAMKTTFTQIVKDKDGNEIIRDEFKSSYDSPWKYPHPGGEVLKEKPANWSKEEWKEYKKANNID